MTTIPKVFVSHASEDKARFVLGFATRLRSIGIDAWLDKWEMLPGDSLIDKMFNEGLKEASAVVIVISKYSIQKKWVAEELNASIVARVSRGTRVIPIVLVGCPVPEPLTATVWERIDNVESYDAEFERISASIFGRSMKPPLGELPKYVIDLKAHIQGLSLIDTLVLKHSCEFAIESGDFHVNPNAVFLNERNIDLPCGEVRDSIEMLNSSGFIDAQYHSGTSAQYNCFYRVTINGMEQYAQQFIHDYENIKVKIASAIVNEELYTNNKIRSRVSAPIALVNHVLMLFESRGLVSMEKYLDGGIGIFHVSAMLRRNLRDASPNL